MRQDQLQKARLARWRQDGNALLTLDDAERWLAETPLCLYLPRYQHIQAPAPSFVEAVAGQPDPTPGPERIGAAHEMLARLVASGAVIALNLFGAPAGIVGEQPDFLATPEALPYLYAMQAERNPKRAPTTAGNTRVSPLAAETWTLLEREGALTAIELRERLGREVTEAATLRALGELWHVMRAVPVPSGTGEPAHWELLMARHRRELNVGSTQSQTTALSILASFYLQSAVAATPEEVEIFLSPVASRSRIRDVVHGLSTTRQLASFPLGGSEQLFVEGTLPEVPEDEAASIDAELSPAAAGEDVGLEQNEPSVIEASVSGPAAAEQHRPAARRTSGPRKFGEREAGLRDFAKRSAGPRRSGFADRARRSGPARERGAGQDRPPRREGGFRPPQRGNFRPRPAAGGPAEGGPLESGHDIKPRFERTGSDRPRTGRPDRPQRPGFARRPGAGRSGTGRSSAGPSGGDRPARFERTDRPAGSTGGAGRPDRPARVDRGGAGRGGFDKSKSSFSGTNRTPPKRAEGERKPRWTEAERAARRPSGPGGPAKRFGSGRPPVREGNRPPRSFSGPRNSSGPRSSSGPRNFSGARREAGAPSGGSFRPRPDVSRPPGRPLRKPEGGGASRGPGRPFEKGSDKRAGGFSKPGRPPRREGDRPYAKPFGDRPARPYTPRPRPEGDDRPPRPFRPQGDRPARPQGDRPARAGGFSRPSGPRSSGPRSSGPGSSGPGASGPGSSGQGARPGSFRRPGDAGTRPPRPAGARPPRPAGGRPAGRPGGFSKPGGGSRPPGRGGFKSGGFKSGGFKPGGRRPGGSAPPTRKPRPEGDEG